MKRFGLFILALLPILSIAQDDDLDDIFDDGDKDSRFYIGTNINILATGTLNVYGDFYPIERFRISAGLGVIPFSSHRDYTFSLLNDQFTSVYRDVSGGTFYSIGLSYKSALENVVDFNYYYYLIFRNRNFGRLEDQFTIAQRKFSLGVGYLIGLPGRFNLDIMAGLASGRERVSDNSILNGISTGTSFERGVGFELTFSINYAL